MSFTSAGFYGFLALVLVLNYVAAILPQQVSKWVQNGMLLADSLLFAGLFGWQTLAAVLMAALLCWGFALWCEKSAHPVGVGRLGMVLMLFGLIAIKYSGMLFSGIGKLVPQLCSPEFSGVFNAVGISYYTLTAIGYLSDVSHKKYRAIRSPLRVLLCISFFPQLPSGPIARIPAIFPQFEKTRKLNYDTFAQGMTELLFGAFRKLVIADSIALAVNPVFNDPQSFSGPCLVLAAIGFSYQLYSDFAGYTEMARGIARLFGIQLQQNFNRPFAARSFAELWNRWHLSLSFWLRDYIYFPMGGSRRGLLRMCLATMTVFAVSGIWHNAGWLFCLWGILNGLFVVEEKLTKKPRAALERKLPGYEGSFLQDVWQRVRVYLIFTVCFIMFRVGQTGDSLAAAGQFYAGLFRDWVVLLQFGRLAAQLKAMSIGRKLTAYLGAAVLLTEGLDWFAARAETETALWLRGRKVWMRMTVYYAQLLLLLFFGQFGGSSFIYFTF